MTLSRPGLTMPRVARTLYLIDGHAQIYRAYFARFGSLSAPSGEPTRATHVFCQMLLGLVRDRRPDYLVMVMDTSDETVFRREIYPDYKAHRDPPPEDLPVQTERIVQILQAVGVPILRVPGFEADDIIATLVERFAGAGDAQPGLHIYVVSKDKDLDQLLRPGVALYDPGSNLEITHENLMEIKGWRPDQALDVQSLSGDSVDNVPGVAGIGPKTAAKLIHKYGSAAAVIEHADELTPKQRENVLAFAPLLDTTRRLLTLRRDVPLEFDLQRAACDRLRWSAARPILESLGFRRLLEQLPADGSGTPPDQAEGRPSAVPAAEAGPRTAAADASEQERGAAGATEGSVAPPGTARAVVASAEHRYTCIDTPEAFDRFVAELRQQRAFAVDTETTGVNPMDADLVGMSFCWRAGEACYLPIRSMRGRTLPVELVRERLGPILADPGRRKVGQNIKYDLIVLRNAGMPVAEPYFDTMIASFVLDPTRRSHGIDALAAGLLGHRMIPISDLIGKGRDQLRMDEVPIEHVTEYAAEDADYTWRLMELFEPQLEQRGLSELFYGTEMPLVSVLAEMEFNGVTIDAAMLRQMGREMAQRAEELARRAHELAGQVFNLDSPRQVAEILFDRLGFQVVRRTRTARSTDAETLAALAAQTGHALPAVLLEYREIQKLRGTYVEALPRCVSRRTGRIHTSYHQTGAVTGRLSSSEPNLQNVPVRTAQGREIRRAFVPRSPDEKLIVADYSQIELRILAHFCADEALRRAFAEDLDVHAFVAAEVNGVPISQVTREMRSRAKAVNFGIIYGQTPFGLARGTGMSQSEARAFIDGYFERYPRIRRFIDECVAAARRDGAVTTLLGRRRPISGLDSRNRAERALAERLAVNTVIQGSAADMIKTAMNRLYARIRSENLPLRMLLQVHDELVCEAPADRAPELARLVADVMEHALPLDVPVKVEAQVGDNWLDAK